MNETYEERLAAARAAVETRLEEAILRALDSGSSPQQKMMGRALAARWPLDMLVWFMAERDEDGDRTADAHVVLTKVWLATLAQTIASTMRPGGEIAMVMLLQSMISELPKYVIEARGKLAAAGKAASA